jgi:quercetin dioxygenase-like cupin family protein
MGTSHRILRTGDRETDCHEWGTITWFAGGDVGNADGLTLGRVVIVAGKSNPRHFHTTCEEALTLLSGRLEHTAADDSVVMEPGDTLVIPPNVPHNATSLGPDDADMIVAYSSADRDFHLE